ncbi:hypothetical protein D3875_17220 [Deinococcus cavernae]|uniref:Uncharacterized protein n=1 Tax=Deinococcus cavernae TaxID=2320857 RepID=A0A418VAA2_9DEIO|nr:hypothetical protein [Deinococcus cavernae]RJF73023.1 hypothetical protein D3875_17220 [Deinococcus cavernae]
MSNFRRAFLLLPLFSLMCSASAAGLLGTRASFFNSAFCRQYACGEPYRSGQNWMYRLNTGDTAFIRRENNDAQGRIELMAVFINEDSFHADVDRQTFADLQRTAIGHVAFTGRIELCYGASGVRELVSYPAPNARSVLCMREGRQTAVALLADLNATTSTAPGSSPAPTVAGGRVKLNQWQFTGCRSERGVTSYLPLGLGAACTLQVQGNFSGQRVLSASFEYELEYPVGGVLAKLRVEGRDTYSAAGGGNVKLTPQGKTLSFTLPINVRARADRRYVRLGVIGTLVFADGTSKRVYETLNIQ